MSDALKITMLEQQLRDMEAAANMQRSATLNTLIDLRVMLEDGDYDEALERLNELTGDEE